METMILTVGELTATNRVAAEQLVGHALVESQRIRIEVSPPAPAADELNDDDRLPEWCHIYRGVSDEEIDRLESTILSHRFDLGQPSD